MEFSSQFIFFLIGITSTIFNITNASIQIIPTYHTIRYALNQTHPEFIEENVSAYIVTNNVGMKIKVMARGGTLIQMEKNNQSYLWENTKDATYFGPNTNNFPLTRGLIVYGGVRYAAVSAEHGLYYDSDWEMKAIKKSHGASIVLSIVDTQAQRDALNDPLSDGQFNAGFEPGRMTKYPVTNMKYTFTITLNENESFVRLKMSVKNPTSVPANAEAWLPMTFPIEEDSQIISNQKDLWRRDEWCYTHKPNIMEKSDVKALTYPHQWDGPCIFYHWPRTNGYYHAINRPSTGQGVAYIIDPSIDHYMKLWSWGKKVSEDHPYCHKYNESTSVYYEAWGSPFNFAFFQTKTFQPHSSQSWSATLLPIENGLNSTDNGKLRKKIEKSVRSCLNNNQ